MKNEAIKSKLIKGQGGFTLLEVIVALSILTFGLLAVGSMQISAIQGNAFGGRLTEGTTLAQDKLETLIALPYDSVQSSAAPEQNGNYSISWIVTQGDPLPNTKRVEVTVSWNDKGTMRSTLLSSVKTLY